MVDSFLPMWLARLRILVGLRLGLSEPLFALDPISSLMQMDGTRYGDPLTLGCLNPVDRI